MFHKQQSPHFRDGIPVLCRLFVRLILSLNERTVGRLRIFNHHRHLDLLAVVFWIIGQNLLSNRLLHITP